MSKFHIGMRVKVVSVDHPESGLIVGHQGFVDAIDCQNEDGEFGNIGVEIDGDDGWCFRPHNLEPILYDGAQPIAESFEEMMDKLREGVVA